MIDEDIPCEDILSQINAAKSALNKCGSIILEGHINHCVKDAFKKMIKQKLLISRKPLSVLRICSKKTIFHKKESQVLSFYQLS